MRKEEWKERKNAMTKQHVLRRAAVLFLACVLMAALAVPVLADGIPKAPDSFVYDEADVLSSSTEQYINMETAALDTACGGQIAVVAVDFTGEYSTADYAYELFNSWGIGDKNKNNGLLLLLVIGAEDYYILPGEGVTDIFSGGTLQTLMDDYLEADFAGGDYDAGVRKTFDRILEIYDEKYDLTQSSVSVPDAGYAGYDEARDAGGSFFSGFFRVIGKILIIAIAVVLIVVVISLIMGGPRGGGGGTGGGGGGGFWNGLLLGSLLNRRRYTYRPPPPPFGGPRYPRPPRPPRPNPPGGFGGGRPGSFGGFGGGRPGGFGGFGGGSSRGGGAGRR